MSSRSSDDGVPPVSMTRTAEHSVPRSCSAKRGGEVCGKTYYRTPHSAEVVEAGTVLDQCPDCFARFVAEGAVLRGQTIGGDPVDTTGCA